MDAPFSLEDVADYPPESFFFHPKSRGPSRCATPSRDDGKLEKFAANLERPLAAALWFGESIYGLQKNRFDNHFILMNKLRSHVLFSKRPGGSVKSGPIFALF
jgi:hypothetical protein